MQVCTLACRHAFPVLSRDMGSAPSLVNIDLPRSSPSRCSCCALTQLIFVP